MARAAAGPLGPREGGEPRLAVDLDAVDPRGGEVAVHAVVELEQPARVDVAHAEERRRVPQQRGLHLPGRRRAGRWAWAVGVIRR